MNQSNRRLVKLLSCSISSPNQQRDFPQTMEYTTETDGVANSILKVVLENLHSETLETLLCDLAGKLGDLFAADACLIISTIADSGKNDLGYWQSEGLAIPNKLMQQLSDLPLSHYNTAPDSSARSFWSSIENLVGEVMPTSAWIGTTTQFQQQTNSLILLFCQSSWTHTQQELLTSNSELMAIAISQIQLQQQVQTKTRYQTLLKNLSHQIGYGDRPQLLFHNCLTEICTALDLDRGLILMLKYQNPLRAKNRHKRLVKGTVEIACRWTRDRAIESESRTSFSLDDSDLCQQAWQNAPKCLYFSSEAPFPDLTTEKVHPYGTALLIAPLMGKKASDTESAMVLGFLVLQHDSFRHWSEDELESIGSIAVQVSTAIMHHQTLNQVQSIVDERTAQLKSSLDVREKLSRKMRQHIEQLQKVNQLKDDFMNSMSHELKTPMTSMKMAIKMLRQPEISPPMREKYLDILEQEWNREYSLIKDLLTLQQVESGELDYSPQELDLNQTLDNLSQLFVQKWQSDKEIELKIVSQPNLKIYTDAESLEYILNELLSNASKYSDPGTDIELTVTSQGIGKRNLEIKVVNTGVGIAPEELPHIFDKFRRGKGVTDRAVPGTGLGLTLVQYLVEHLNGTIEVTSEPLADDDSTAYLTTFVLKLPQIQPSIG